MLGGQLHGRGWLGAGKVRDRHGVPLFRLGLAPGSAGGQVSASSSCALILRVKRQKVRARPGFEPMSGRLPGLFSYPHGWTSWLETLPQKGREAQ